MGKRTASRTVKILERTIFTKFTAYPLPSPQLEFHPVIADTDTHVTRLGGGKGKDELEESENRILRNQIDSRVQLTDSERQELAELGAKVGKKALAEIATVAKAKPSRGKVVCLRAARPRPIWDGPRRRQRWLGGRRGYYDREAA